jgi:hypothetical protein
MAQAAGSARGGVGAQRWSSSGAERRQGADEWSGRRGSRGRRASARDDEEGERATGR